MKKNTSLVSIILLLASLSIGAIAILEDVPLEQSEVTEGESEEPQELQEEAPLQNEAGVLSVEDQLREVLLTKEQQAELKALPKDPIEFLALVIQRLQEEQA